MNVRAGAKVAALFALLVSCRVGSADPIDASPAPSPSGLPSGTSSSSSRTKAHAPPEVHSHEETVVEGERLVVDTFTFALADVSLALVDVGATRDLGATLKSADDVLTVNAGFFDEHDAPVGLSRSNKAQLSAFAPKLSGGVLEVHHGVATLLETETYDTARAPDFAVQCRPRLVVAGKANVKSDDKKRAERTSVCILGNGKRLSFAIIKNEEKGPSLFALGRYLAQKGCRDALALDGGPSTGAVYAGPNGKLEWPLRGPVRQAIVVTRRKTP